MFGLFKKRLWKVCYIDKHGNAMVVRVKRLSTANQFAKQAKAEAAKNVQIFEVFDD